MEQQETNESGVATKGNSTLEYLASQAPVGVDGIGFVKLIKAQLLASKDKEPTNEELMYYMTVCKQSGLNPMRKEIYGIYRKGKLTIQTSIDGLRAVAERTGKYAGSDEPVFEYTEDGKLHKATVSVKKIVEGIVVSTTRSALWGEYYGNTVNQIVKQMPTVMLAKCAEAQALRAAFPNLGQLYTDEEMIQADTQKIEVVQVDKQQKDADIAAAKANLLKGGEETDNGSTAE